MFAEDLPDSDKKPPASLQHTSAANTYSMHFMVSGAATDYDLYVGNGRRPNNNNNPNRGRIGRERAPARGNPNRGVLGRGVPGRGQPRKAPRGVNPQRGQGPWAVPARNLRGNPQPPNLGGRNPPNSNPRPNPGGPRGPAGPGGLGPLGGPGGPGPLGPNGPPAGQPASRGADPAVLAILDRLVEAQEKQVTDKKDTKWFTQFPSNKFDGTKPGKSLDHWNLFMQYWNYVLHKGYVPVQNDASYFAIFREQFVLTLSGIAYSWFKQIIPVYHNIEDVKAAFLKWFNEWGQTVKQHMTAWNNLKFDLNKHDMDVFMRQLQWLASILYMAEDQTLEKFKDAFDMNIAAHLIECATLDEAREKVEQLVFIYKSNNPTSASSVLIHTQQADKREVQEHQLAAVDKVEKPRNSNDKVRGGGNNSLNRQNTQQQSNNQNNRGQGNYRQQRGRFNYRGNNPRGRGFNQNDQRQNSRGRGYGRG